MPFLRALPLFAAAVLCTIPVMAAEQGARLPVETFASLPSFNDPVLSPDGERIAYAIQYDGHMHVVTQRLKGEDRRLIPPLKDGEVVSFLWANNHTLIVRYGGSVNRIMFRTRTFETRQIAFDIATDAKPVWLGKPEPGKGFSVGFVGERVSQFESIVDLLPDDPDHILMQADFSLQAMPTVYRVTLENGRRAVVHRGRADILRWFTDQKGEVRFGDGVSKDGPEATLMKADGQWVRLDKIDWAKTYDVKGFANDDRTLYVSGTNKYGTKGLYRLDPETGSVVETIYENPKFDADGFVDHPATGHLAGIAYRDDFHRIQYLDKDLDLLQRSLNAVLKGSLNTIIGKAREKDLYLILSESDRNPGDYYIYDRSAHNLSYIASRYRGIEADDMAATEAVTIPVRDGGSIPGYLTLPQGHTDARGLPAIILPHGGPIGARDDAEWDYMAQFIANRGYAVLKPNYRGSGGYGKAYEEAGKNQWGGLMQDDVTDATKWLIDKGGVDAKRVCIVGGSYGGYAALMGTIKAPGLYKCAVSINGVTDLPDLKYHDKKFIGGTYWAKSLGLEGADDKSVSPIDRADEISAPVLLISAKDDTVVPNRQSRDLDKKLHKLKKPSRYVEIKSGEHWLATADARKAALTALGDFLDRQIGGR